MWAWMPVFLSIVLIGKACNRIQLYLGLVISITLHITGVFANMISGVFSDRFGSRNVLIMFAISSSSSFIFYNRMGDSMAILDHYIDNEYLFYTVSLPLRDSQGVLTAALTDATRNV